MGGSPPPLAQRKESAPVSVSTDRRSLRWSIGLSPGVPPGNLVSSPRVPHLVSQARLSTRRSAKADESEHRPCIRSASQSKRKLDASHFRSQYTFASPTVAEPSWLLVSLGTLVHESNLGRRTSAEVPIFKKKPSWIRVNTVCPWPGQGILSSSSINPVKAHNAIERVSVFKDAT